MASSSGDMYFNVSEVNSSLSYLLEQVALIFDILKTFDAQYSQFPQVFSTKQDVYEKNKPNGYAGLNAAGKIDASQLPINGLTYRGVYDAANNIPDVLTTSNFNTGDFLRVISTGQINLPFYGLVTLNSGDLLIFDGTQWSLVLNQDSVLSVNNKKGVVTLSLQDVATNLKDIDYASSNNIMYNLGTPDSFFPLSANPSLTDTLNKLSTSIKALAADVVRPTKFVLKTAYDIASAKNSTFIVDNVGGNLVLNDITKRNVIVKDDFGLDKIKNLDYSNPDNIFIKLAHSWPTAIVNSPVAPKPSDPTLCDTIDEINKTLNLCVRSTRKINNYALANDLVLSKSDIGLSNVLNVDCTRFSNIKLDNAAGLDGAATNLTFTNAQSLVDVLNILLTKISTVLKSTVLLDTTLCPPNSFVSTSVFDANTNIRTLYLAWSGINTSYSGNVKQFTYDYTTNTLNIDVATIQIYESNTSLFKMYVGSATDPIAAKQNKLILEQKPNSHVAAIQFPTDDAGNFNSSPSFTNTVQINKNSIRLGNVKNIDCSETDNISCLKTSFSTGTATTFFQPASVTSISLTDFLTKVLLTVGISLTTNNQSSLFSIVNNTSTKTLTFTDVWNNIVDITGNTYTFPVNAVSKTPSISILRVFKSDCTIALENPVAFVAGSPLFLFVVNSTSSNLNFTRTLPTSKTFLLLKSLVVFVYSDSASGWTDLISACEPDELNFVNAAYTKPSPTCLVSRTKIEVADRVNMTYFQYSDFYGPSLDTNIFFGAVMSFPCSWEFILYFNQPLSVFNKPYQMVTGIFSDTVSGSRHLTIYFIARSSSQFSLCFETPAGTAIDLPYSTTGAEFNKIIKITFNTPSNLVVFSNSIQVGTMNLSTAINCYSKFYLNGPIRLRGLSLSSTSNKYNWNFDGSLKMTENIRATYTKNAKVQAGEELICNCIPVYDITDNYNEIILPRMPHKDWLYLGAVYSPTNDSVIFSPHQGIHSSNIHYYRSATGDIRKIDLGSTSVTKWMFTKGTFNWTDNAIYFGIQANRDNWMFTSNTDLQPYVYFDCFSFTLKELPGAAFVQTEKFVNCIYSKVSLVSIFIPLTFISSVAFSQRIISKKKLITVNYAANTISFDGDAINAFSNKEQTLVYVIPKTKAGLVSSKWPRFKADAVVGFIPLDFTTNLLYNSFDYDVSCGALSIAQNQIFIIPSAVPTLAAEKWLYVDCKTETVQTFDLTTNQIKEILCNSTAFDMPARYRNIVSCVYIPPIDSILIMVDYFDLQHELPIQPTRYTNYEAANFTLASNSNSILISNGNYPSWNLYQGVVKLPAVTSSYADGNFLFVSSTADWDCFVVYKKRQIDGTYANGKTTVKSFNTVVLRLETTSTNVREWVYFDSISHPSVQPDTLGYKMPLTFNHILLNCSTKTLSAVASNEMFKTVDIGEGVYLESGKVVFSPRSTLEVVVFDFAIVNNKFALYKMLQ